jgi:hypothetical protein
MEFFWSEAGRQNMQVQAGSWDIPRSWNKYDDEIIVEASREIVSVTSGNL